MQPESIINLSENLIIEQIESASTRLVYVAPGITASIARAIENTWSRLGVENVTVVLDVDPEVCRLGYGTIEGLEYLKQSAQDGGTLICYHKEGIRIGILIADNSTIIFTPTPLLVEAGSNKPDHPNAIILSVPPRELVKDIGLDSAETSIIERTFGLDSVGSNQIETVREDLKRNPPQKFDLARKVRVFNSRFEFVELRMEGCYISRKTASIPAELMGMANSEDMKDRLRSSFKVIGSEDTFDEKEKVSEKYLRECRKNIESEFLCNISGYGKVILRENKEEFNKRVTELEREIEEFKKQVKEKLQATIEKNATSLVESLLPGVKQNKPPKWTKFLGNSPTEDELRGQLKREIDSTFGDVDMLVKDMKVEAIFKGVTYEALQSEDFIEAAKIAFPNLKEIHEEFDAAKQTTNAKHI